MTMVSHQRRHHRRYCSIPCQGDGLVTCVRFALQRRDRTGCERPSSTYASRSLGSGLSSHALRGQSDLPPDACLEEGLHIAEAWCLSPCWKRHEAATGRAHHISR
ncbi:hypothetical protein Bbelb_063110 [Branchiostoma belcheri]|nr:hypothetical protein Bbelb_063110 [Branchiostoma belcheri]